MKQNIKNFYHLLQAIIANVIYGFPSKKLHVIAITGTDGKTTTTTLLYHILKKAGFKVALISTVAAYIGHDEIDTGFHVTTPSPFALQRLLKTIVNKGMEYVVLEVTSHGIDQNRVWGISPDSAGITNVTHEHLDYHKNFDSYLATKGKLLTLAKRAYINADAKDSVKQLEHIVKEAGYALHEAGKPEATPPWYTLVSAKDLPGAIKKATEKRFGSQQYNFENVALATNISRDLGVKEKSCAEAIASFPGVPGRMETVATQKGIKVIVDFAHTPNALEKALTSVRPKHGRLISIFGCAGLRDHTKRPLMGDIASRIADIVILTAEDPRTEDVWAIISQIKSGIRQGNHAKIASIPDRFDAIAFALKELAHPGDTVIITGKGHERSMCFDTTEYPWNDADAVRTIIES